MKILPCIYIKQLDVWTIEKEPIASIDLMERASKAVMNEIVARWGVNTPIRIFAGPGNNGGDALAVARMLGEKEYDVEVFLFNTKESLSPDCALNKERLLAIEKVKFTEIVNKFNPPALTEDMVVIDGLFGSGRSKPLSGGFAAVVKFINASAATVVSIDMPSGLMGEENTYNIRAHIIRADLTLSFQLPKLSFLFPENEELVGEVKLLDIGLSKEGLEKIDTDYYLTEEKEIRERIKPRDRFSHKGTFGHALIIAGSYGMAGASVLAARACLRSGAGLVTLHVPGRNNAIVQTSIPEVIVQHDIHENYFAVPVDTDDFQVVGIGPGLGRSEETETAVLEQIRSCQVPMVIDADALNILSENKKHLHYIPEGSILTPHPKEFDRLAGKSRDSYERLMKACDLAAALKCYIVLKGAYTAVVTPDKKCYFNPTGNPGMSTGGSGDVLTGIITALLAQGYNPEEAARIGVYVHGLAGDLAARELSMPGMIAGDIVEFLPKAWLKLT